jgi:predicted small secreted protein
LKTILVILFAATSLTGCGTTRGILDGTGTVLEGAAKDLRSAGDMLGR